MIYMLPDSIGVSRPRCWQGKEMGRSGHWGGRYFRRCWGEGETPLSPEQLADEAPSTTTPHSLQIWRVVGSIWSASMNCGDLKLYAGSTRVANWNKIVISSVMMMIKPIWRLYYVAFTPSQNFIWVRAVVAGMFTACFSSLLFISLVFSTI